MKCVVINPLLVSQHTAMI